MPCTAENNFTPELPKEHVDIIYLCSPNNPTGTTLSRDELAKWVKYAKDNKAIIFIMIAAYAYYITEEDVPRTIYEIEGAKRCSYRIDSFLQNSRILQELVVVILFYQKLLKVIQKMVKNKL